MMSVQELYRKLHGISRKHPIAASIHRHVMRLERIHLHELRFLVIRDVVAMAGGLLPL
jgi:hypothetical protein